MKRVKIIANPNSGRGAALGKILELIELMSHDEYEIELLFTHLEGDGKNFAANYTGEDFIICSGGDGTVNEVVNGIYLSKRDTPLAILQSGTVNDFANAQGLPTSPFKFYNMIKNFNIKTIDLGLAGERAFINVAAGGMLTEIAYSVTAERKASLGNMAYYLEGVKELLEKKFFKYQKSINLKIKSKEFTGDVDSLLFLITNSTSVGGFKKMAPFADVSDGYLDVLIFKKIKISDAPELFASLVGGKHLDHNKVIYLKTKNIKIESEDDVTIDVDGEKTSTLPMDFKVLENRLKIIVP
ncbi:MAG: diacylglycerol kinase family lipid kinase [Peptoniphilus harei]|nr:diacylglycerol kinase family lipid kinase [Peptoniphilus harei]MDU1023653.1 diacylglycerol kinase family lipid kinase [Peptoniphilus harei]MDU3010446.1 diacylglycerol kinase family lipid kinase [Peptoniphilus harei]MDU5467611.1 diacylglycerol kinase family lipid kinase [Peptoniphilus harei]MDU5571228.1 diacylglycerol kinase family lipid kinase [Peptoniphilus harei]